MCASVMLFACNIAASPALRFVYPGFFAGSDLTISRRFPFLTLDVALLFAKGFGFPAREVTILSTILDALMLAPLFFTGLVLTLLSDGLELKAHKSQQEKKQYFFHDYLI